MNSMLAHRKNCPTLSTAAPSTQASPRRQIGGRRASIGTECLSSGRAWAEAPRWGGRAKSENSSRRHPWKCGLKRFLAVRKVLAGEVGGLFLGSLLVKNFRRRDRDHLIPPRRMDAAVCRAEVC